MTTQRGGGEGGRRRRGFAKAQSGTGSARPKVAGGWAAFRRAAYPRAAYLPHDSLAGYCTGTPVACPARPEHEDSLTRNTRFRPSPGPARGSSPSPGCAGQLEVAWEHSMVVENPLSLLPACLSRTSGRQQRAVPFSSCFPGGHESSVHHERISRRSSFDAAHPGPRLVQHTTCRTS